MPQTHICPHLRFCQGEARWDDPAAFQESNNHALVERGYEDALAAQQGGVLNGANGAASTDPSTLAQYYGERRVHAVGHPLDPVLVLFVGDTFDAGANQPTPRRSCSVWLTKCMILVLTDVDTDILSFLLHALYYKANP